VILARVDLPKNPAHARTIVTQQHKQVFNYETVLAKFIDKLDMR